jgi:hypothetical protein
MDKTRISLRVVARKPEGKRLFGRFRCRWTGNAGIKMNVELKMRGFLVDSSGCV